MQDDRTTGSHETESPCGQLFGSLFTVLYAAAMVTCVCWADLVDDEDDDFEARTLTWADKFEKEPLPPPWMPRCVVRERKKKEAVAMQRAPQPLPWYMKTRRGGVHFRARKQRALERLYGC